jgi:hypothetical protein
MWHLPPDLFLCRFVLAQALIDDLARQIVSSLRQKLVLLPIDKAIEL